MKKPVCVLLMVVAFLPFILGGCSDNKTEEQLNHSSDRFTVVKEENDRHLVIVDNESGYEYFATPRHGGSYIIGGNVLDEDGRPKKYTK